MDARPESSPAVMPPTNTADIAIVGGGAAGLAGAIFAAAAAPAGRRIVLLDGARSLGAKILVSGGGRCNVTHDVVVPEDFNGSRHVVRNVLAAFDVTATVRWFTSMGVELKREETGKLFPMANTARAVLNALLKRCAQVGVIIRCGCRVTSVRQSEDEGMGFIVEHAAGALRCRRVILAAGGRSLPRSGSDGSGWEIVRQLGHSVTPTCAALVPLVLDARMFHARLAGIASEAELSTFAGGRLIDRRTGSLLWTHFGISGPVVMDASRHWVMAQESGAKPIMTCNLVPPDGFEALERWLIGMASSRAKLSVTHAIALRMPERVATALVEYARIDPATTCGHLTRESRRALVHALTALSLPVLQHRGWNYAEVTAGGVPLNEIDFRTMESRKTPGLYIAGEMLDCDGRIGGFNFQWAWATGYLAGMAAGRE
jgi:predicted Rossmann fold flavoprotein